MSVTPEAAYSTALVRNPFQRYGLDSTLLETFKFGEDSSLTFYIQKDLRFLFFDRTWSFPDVEKII